MAESLGLWESTLRPLRRSDRVEANDQAKRQDAHRASDVECAEKKLRTVMFSTSVDILSLKERAFFANLQVMNSTFMRLVMGLPRALKPLLSDNDLLDNPDEEPLPDSSFAVGNAFRAVHTSKPRELCTHVALASGDVTNCNLSIKSCPFSINKHI